MSKSNHCPGSGLKPTGKIWRDKTASLNKKEGFRTNCPVCGKVSAIGPSSGNVVRHRAKYDIDALYERIYNRGYDGVSMRPEEAVMGDTNALDVWVMAYLDGLADGGYNMKVGAFKRWINKNLKEDSDE